MAAMMLCYADEVECLDVSEIMFHRAAYPEWIEADSRYMTQAMWDDLKRTNDKLRAAMEARMDVAKFESITGVTLDQLFDTATRIDVTLTAEQAKEIGLVNKVNKITPELQAFVEENTSVAIAAMAAEGKIPAAPKYTPVLPTPPTTSTTHKTKNMTLAELKAQHPEAYAAAVQEGTTQERDRVASWMEFADIDAAAVKAGIEAGTELSRKDYAAFTRKGIEKAALGKIEDGNPEGVETPGDDGAKPAATAEAQKLEASMDEVDKMLKVGKYAPAKA